MNDNVKCHAPHGDLPQPEDRETRPASELWPASPALSHQRDQALAARSGEPVPSQAGEAAARGVVRNLRDTDSRDAPDTSGPESRLEHPPGMEVPQDAGRRANYPKYPRSKVRAPALRRRKR